MKASPAENTSHGILILINVRWWNATAFYAVNLARILHNNGHKVFVGCRRSYPAFEMARTHGLNTVHLNFYGFNIVALASSFFRMLWLIRKENLQLINSHRSEDHTFALLAKLLTRAKFVLTRSTKRKITRNPLSTMRYRLCDAMIVTCRSILEKNHSVLLPIIDKINVIHGSTDEENFGLSPAPNDVRHRFGIPGDKVIVGIVGRLSRTKDQHTFIQAAARVLDARKDVFFVIAGKDANVTGVELTRQLRQLSIEKHFSMISHIDNIDALMRLIDIGVISSVRSETISRVLLEFMYLKKPVIGSRVNSIGEIIQPGITGELFSPGDDAALADRILHLAANPDQRTLMGAHAFDLYQRAYSEKVFLESSLTAFDTIL